MNGTQVVAVFLAVVAIGLGSLAILKPSQIINNVPTLGAQAGPDYTETQRFNQSFVDGSGCYSTTTTGVLTSAALARNKCIVIAAAGAGQGALTVTLPATSTMAELVPSKGSCRSWWVDASGVAAATTTTFAAGTGVNVVGLDATGAGTGADVIDGLEYGQITLCRETDTDVTAFVQEWIHAD